MMLLIGNLISLVAAVFTCLSCFDKREKWIYLWQVWQCSLLAIAAIFFGSYAGIVTLAVCAIRNLLLAYKKYSTATCILLAVLTVVLGAVINNNGYIGWIVIAANTLYTLGAYFAKNVVLIKLNIIVDLILWMIYEVLIFDIPSLISDLIAISVAVWTIISHIKVSLRNRKQN